MVMATVPAKYAKVLGTWITKNDVKPDGQAGYVPHGLRVIESLLLRHFSENDIAVCYPDQLHLFVGPRTRVVGIHAHNPMGITFATDIYSHLWGRTEAPINAAEFKRLIRHPVLLEHKSHLQVIVGGPGSWQLQHAGVLDEWGVDCVVDGEAEEVALQLFVSAAAGEALPRKVEGHSPQMQNIPPIRHRSTYGVVEITRGCGRGCQFCSVALRAGKSYPIEQILHNVRIQAAEGADTFLLTTEDLWLYEQGPRFQTNLPALKTLFRSVAAVPGVKHIMLSHGTMAPVVRNPELIEELSPWVVDMSVTTSPESTHPGKFYGNFFIGLETGSPRMFEQYMKGKSYPYRPEQWPDVVLKGMEILNKHNWFPFCTWILGLPGETREDTKKSLDLLHALKGAKWCSVPTLFLPLENTRMAARKMDAAELFQLTDLQWEFFFTCWRYNLDFFRRQPTYQWKFRLGVPIYYSLVGRRLFGSKIKYPLFRLGHFPERMLKKRLYLDLDAEPTMKTPASVEIPAERAQTAASDLRIA